MLIKSKQSDSSPAMDLTPVIDMVFLLLIFFLVATTFHQTEREMQVALPVAAAGPISASLRELVINVDSDGRIIVSQKTIEPEELRSRITNAVKANPQQKVTVRGDRRAAYAHIVRVLDICKGSGIQEPYLDTVISE